MVRIYRRGLQSGSKRIRRRKERIGRRDDSVFTSLNHSLVKKLKICGKWSKPTEPQSKLLPVPLFLTHSRVMVRASNAYSEATDFFAFIGR